MLLVWGSDGCSACSGRILVYDPADGNIAQHEGNIDGKRYTHAGEEGAFNRGEPPYSSEEDEESDKSAELRKDRVHALVEVFPMNSLLGGSARNMPPKRFRRRNAAPSERGARNREDKAGGKSMSGATPRGKAAQ